MTDMHREAFERWAKDCRLYSLEREDGEPQIYRDWMTAAAFSGWCSAMRYRDEPDPWFYLGPLQEKRDGDV